MRKSTIISILVLLCFKGLSYPITPQTLRKLIDRSDFIVIGSVYNPIILEIYTVYDSTCSCNKTVKQNSLFGDGIADLSILKSLYGHINSDSISVIYPTFSNPRPPNYRDGKKVITFLTKSDSLDFYETVGLSYGTILFDSTETTKHFEKLINDYLEIKKIKTKRKRKKAIAAWLVECCERRQTRWNGAYELSRERHWASYYDQSKNPRFDRYLTKSDKIRLEQIVLESDTIGYSELCLSDFVHKEHEDSLREILIFNLEYHRTYFAEDLMRRYLEIDDKKELKVLFEKYEALDLNEDNEEAQEITEDFVKIARKK